MSANYAPGQKNIGPEGIRRRRRSGFIGAGVSLLCFLVLLWIDAPRLTRLVLFFPILIATIGFVQAHFET